MEATLDVAADMKGKEFVDLLITERVQYKAAVKEFRRMYILAAIRACGNNKAKAGREFGIHENTVHMLKMRMKKSVEES